MTTAGRKLKPKNLKLIQGTFHRDRANPSEPKPHMEILLCPKFLRGEVRKQYGSMAKKLARIGLMKEKVYPMIAIQYTESAVS
jgi:hypothetical protein